MTMDRTELEAAIRGEREAWEVEDIALGAEPWYRVLLYYSNLDAPDAVGPFTSPDNARAAAELMIANQIENHARLDELAESVGMDPFGLPKIVRADVQRIHPYWESVQAVWP